jgi:mannose-6-phosphate isomerase
LKEILNVEQVQQGDLFFVPAGRVHALGPGVLLAEIQQTSDTTYRIYDWDRTDSEGKSRELHTEEALEAIDFEVQDTYRTSYIQAENKTVNLIDCPAFTTNLVDFNEAMKRDLSYIDSFIIYLCTEGSCTLKYDGGEEKLKKGEVILLPAVMERVVLIPGLACKLLEIYDV